VSATRGWLVFVTCVAGCRQIFGIGEAQPASDAASDGVEIDAASCVTFDAPASADVVLLSAVPNQGHGSDSISNIGVTLPSEGLFRFDVPAFDPTLHLASLRLTVPFATSSTFCGATPTCQPCAPIAASGSFAVEYATSAWDEATACFNEPMALGSWAIAGAKGLTDRSAAVGTAAYQAATTLVIELDPTLVPAWTQNQQLSVVVTAVVAAVTVAPQKQYATIDGACNPTQAPVVLRFTVCK